MVYLFLAQGFEEIEALTQVDLLRRAGIDIKSVSVADDKKVIGSHGIEVSADCKFSEIDLNNIEMLILPGGLPGVENLYKYDELNNLIKSVFENGGFVCAICAAPIILGRLGILEGKMATCYPGFEKELTGASYFDCPVVVDGNVITSKSAGCAVDFAFELISSIKGEEEAKKVISGIYYE